MDSAIFAEQFQRAWINWDIQALSVCLSDKLSFYSSDYIDFNGSKTDLLGHLAHHFQMLNKNQACSTSSFEKSNLTLFTIICQYVGLIPVTQYLVNDQGIFLVPFLEPRLITEESTIRYEIKGHKINTIEIISKKIVQCRKTA